MSGCFHCGAALPANPPLARIGGAARAVCCQGCRAVAEWIGELGLGDYYRLRSACAAAPGDARDAAASAAALARPDVARHVVRASGNGRSEALLALEGVRCAACCWLIERTLGRLPGVLEVGVNASARRARIVYDDATASIEGIAVALARIGYRALPLDGAALDDGRRRESRDAQKRLAVAALGAMQAMMYATALWFGAFDAADGATRDLFRWLTLLAATPVVFYSAAPFFAGAVRLLAARTLGMDVPVAIAIALMFAGSAVAVLAGGPDVWFESVSMFVFFLCAGRYLEMRARHHAGDLGDALSRLTPAFADRLKDGGALRRVGAIELRPDDRVLIADGARVPADGVLESAACRADESVLCGESSLARKQRGDTLYAGTLVVGMPATVRVTRVGADTVVAGIVALTARAAATRPALAREDERAAARLAASVLGLAVLTALGWALLDPPRAFAAAVAVLVVACPCAFALAAPAAVTRTLAVLTGRGVLVAQPDSLAHLARATHVVFDKTGTLTEPSIEHDGDVRACAIAAALAQASRHPLARAFLDAAPTAIPPVDDRDSVAGLGVAGRVDGRRYRLGRADYAAGGDANDEGIVLADEAGVVATFRVRERLRPGAAALVHALVGEGLIVSIASGDAAARVRDVAAQLGIDAFAARQSPADKLATLAALRASGARVVVVGDGVNDAPMLAAADVGVAVGTAADAAHAASGLVLTGGLDALRDARALSREMLAILRQNRRWAVAYNVTTIPLAALGLFPPWLAALGMSASSLGVVLNSLRIGRGITRPAPSPAPLPLRARAA
jgi:Cu2+-exporting ATPase